MAHFTIIAHRLLGFLSVFLLLRKHSEFEKSISNTHADMIHKELIAGSPNLRKFVTYVERIINVESRATRCRWRTVELIAWETKC